MRIARVLACFDETRQGAACPIVALERDGALYDVAELERVFDTAYSPERFAASSDFHTRVIALSCAGLDELDDRLKCGDRPTSARLFSESFVWLAPCDDARALYVQLERAAPPRYRIATSRSLFGHESAVPFPSEEKDPKVELSIAAMLGEEARCVTAAEAERRVIGYAIEARWIAGDLEAIDPQRARDFAAQLGPVLITRDEKVDVASLAPTLRSTGSLVSSSALSIGESIAFVARNIELRAGDVIGLAPLSSEPVAFDETIECSFGRLGRLRGKPVRGPAPAS